MMNKVRALIQARRIDPRACKLVLAVLLSESTKDAHGHCHDKAGHWVSCGDEELTPKARQSLKHTRQAVNARVQKAGSPAAALKAAKAAAQHSYPRQSDREEAVISTLIGHEWTGGAFDTEKVWDLPGGKVMVKVDVKGSDIHGYADKSTHKSSKAKDQKTRGWTSSLPSVSVSWSVMSLWFFTLHGTRRKSPWRQER
jgi:hypothetical protein